MNGEESYELFQTLIDDSDLDEDTFLTLLNVAKNRREEMRPWQYLKKLDSSKTATVGDTYQTSKALPNDFRLDYKMFVGTDREYFPVPFEKQHIFKNSAMRYFVDVGTGYFYLTGSVSSSQTIYLFYIKTTDDVAHGTSWSAPTRFHPLLVYDVVGFVMNGVDADDIYARMAPEHKIAALNLDRAMVAWDTALKLRSMNGSFSSEDNDAGVPLGQM